MRAEMLLPVRCFTCNAVIASHFEKIAQLRRDGMPHGDAMDACGVRMVCCRRMLLSSVDITPQLNSFPTMDRQYDGGDTKVLLTSRRIRCVATD